MRSGNDLILYMEEENGLFFIVLIIICIWFWRDHHSLKDQLEKSQSDLVDSQYALSSCEDESQSYQDALDEANSNIEDAQSYAWSSYEEMGDALDNLTTVNP